MKIKDFEMYLELDDQTTVLINKCYQTLQLFVKSRSEGKTQPHLRDDTELFDGLINYSVEAIVQLMVIKWDKQYLLKYDLDHFINDEEIKEMLHKIQEMCDLQSQIIGSLPYSALELTGQEFSYMCKCDRFSLMKGKRSVAKLFEPKIFA